jgi:hypothetical protein
MMSSTLTSLRMKKGLKMFLKEIEIREYGKVS